MRKANRIKLLSLAAALVFLTACESEYGGKIEELSKAGGRERQAQTAGNAVQEGEKEETAKAEQIEIGEMMIQPQNRIEPYVSDGTSYYYKAQDKYLSVYNGMEFEDIYIKGVNLGLGKPGYFPGETAITKEEYARWFQQISDMNANCIRVYTIQPPDFYEAFYEFNQSAKEPLYLFHGVWYDETRLVETADAFDEQLYTILQEDMRNLVDILHGNCVIAPEAGKASGTYQYDISTYVIGWILGIESEAEFVATTNEKHPDITSYEGVYVCADNIEPFEVFWAQIGDYLISYEVEQYGMQRPLSYANWPTTDMLEHPSETMVVEDYVDLNVENLKTTEAFPCGLFASYHIYSYYPNFMFTQKSYIDYRDENGNANTYKAYLEDLIAQHHIPVVVAEYGIPTSRGVAHINEYTGFDQGHKTEEEQGRMLVSMMEDIQDTGYAGGIVFTWQDEWFKKAWNTEEYTNPNRRANWCDVMTCEQHYGIMDFLPGESKETVILDGDASEWSREDILLKTEEAVLSVKHDCKYLYLMIEKENADFDSDTLYIPFDITPNSGSMIYEDMEFEQPTDFLMVINGKENSELLVHSYYDLYQYEYGEQDEDMNASPEIEQPDNALFWSIYTMLGRELILPDRNEVIPLQRFGAGEFTFGISDCDSEEYNPLADFYYQDDILEIRIPWLMLNFRDPSEKEIEDDFRQNGYFSGMSIDGIGIGLSGGGSAVQMSEYQWEEWDYYPYFERLRESYYMLQEQFKNLVPVTTS